MQNPTLNLQSKMDNLTHPQHRPDIDGLRAVSILLVVGFHAFPTIVLGGFIGVDIFFVISGFLISKIIFESLAQNQFSFLEFYRRRINRIFPALILVMIACFVFGWFFLFSDEFMQLGKHIAGGAGFISNLVLWNESGYFDNGADEKPLLHLWSLGIEEQFYIVWPIMLWFSWKYRINPLITSIAIWGLSFFLNIDKIESDVATTFYAPQTRFWELQVGAMLAYGIVRKPVALTGPLYNVKSVLGLALIAAGLILISNTTDFPGWWALLPTIGAALIIGSEPGAWVNKLLSNKLLVWLGLISYSLYLWHWPILTFLRIIRGRDLSIEASLLALALSTILAYLTYKFIETPLRNSSNNRVKALALIVLMLIIGSVGYLTFSKEGFVHRQIAKDSAKIQHEFALGVRWSYEHNELCLKNFPFDEAIEYGHWFCMQNRDEKPTLLILGNSFANHLYPGMMQNSTIGKQSIVSIGDCEVVDLHDIPPTLARNKKFPCTAERMLHQQSLIGSIVESGSVKFIILSGLRPKPSRPYIQAMTKKITYYENKGIRVVVFVPHIRLNYPIKACFTRPGGLAQENCEVSQDEYQKRMDDFDPMIQSLSRTNPRVAVFNQNDLFCTLGKCSMLRDGLPLFRDNSTHLSEHASIELASIFEKWARVNVPEMVR